MLGVLSDASSSDAVGDAGGDEGGWDGGEATHNGDGAPAVATDAASTRNGSKRQRLSGKFPSTVGVFIICVTT